ncbi:MAG: PAS domain S-box protein, partial [Candidatus Marinimicrobia bacterium]|nr:PAS domain S-box protein [Candidatus Neomarinimicrobiota bacterium]
TMILGGQWGLFFAFLNIGAVIYFKSAGVDESTGPPEMGVTDQFYALGLSSVFFVTALIMMAACYTITCVIQRIKQAEDLADTHSETAKLYFDFTSAIMIRLDKHGHLQIMNRIACTFFGCSNQDMTSLPFIDFIENDEQKNIFRTCLESLQKQDADSESIIEIVLTNNQNQKKSFQWKIRAIRNEKNEVCSFLLSGTDLSEIHESRDRIKFSNNLLERVGSLLLVANEDGQIVYAGPSVKEILGYEPEELLGDGWWHLSRRGFENEYIHSPEKIYLSSAARGQVDIIDKPYERMVYDKQGNPHWILWQDSVGPNNYIIGVGQDITDRKMLEQSLEQSRNSMRHLVDNMQEGVYKILFDGTIEFANQKLAEMHGFSSARDLIGKNVRDLEFESSYPRDQFITSLKEKGAIRNFQSTWINQEGDEIHTLENASIMLDSEGTVIGYEGTVLNITEEKRLEQQFLQSQKMEAIGRVTGTVAHDFNNLLTIIKGYGSLALTSASGNDKLINQLTQIVEAGEKAENLTNQLLTFSRKNDFTPVTIDLNIHLQKLEDMLHRLIGEDVELVTRFKDEILPIHIDTSHLEQVIMNLVVNARDAMPGGGTLVLETQQVTLSNTLLKGANDPTLQGKYILLSVSDTGYGMDKETQEKIFEPFFTTKDKGKGTGLGLSTVYSIVRQNGGDIHLYSEKGIGTTFKIYLPQVVKTKNKQEGIEVQDNIPLEGKETILVVEDEADVLSFVMDTLTNYGYKVVGSNDSEKAFSLYRSMQPNIDMIVSDVILPKLSGPELVRKILVSQPALKVVYMSGYSESMIGKHGLLGNEINFIQKPFSPYELTRKIRQSLDVNS